MVENLFRHFSVALALVIVVTCFFLISDNWAELPNKIFEYRNAFDGLLSVVIAGTILIAWQKNNELRSNSSKIRTALLAEIYEVEKHIKENISVVNRLKSEDGRICAKMHVEKMKMFKPALMNSDDINIVLRERSVSVADLWNIRLLMRNLDFEIDDWIDEVYPAQIHDVVHFKRILLSNSKRLEYMEKKLEFCAKKLCYLKSVIEGDDKKEDPKWQHPTVPSLKHQIED